MTNFINLFLSFGIWLFVFGGCCANETQYEERKSGRLKFIKTLHYGSVGTHGSQGWYVSDRNFYINDKSWKPPNISNVKDDISDCEPSPNPEVEVLKCTSFKDLKDTTYILRISENNPVWETVISGNYQSNKNSGEWVNDGKFLLFKDFYYNVQNSEKIEIKGLPDFPANRFRATSPDLSVILYEGDCFYADEVTAEVDARRIATCNDSNKNRELKLSTFWLVGIKTGETKIFRLSREKYDWLYYDSGKSYNQDGWLKFFQKQLVWEKDKDGKYQLISPKEEPIKPKEEPSKKK
ncbi:MAG TPA: hypothetical protein PKY82_18775 [Pyrinomonadaceae bacterium]|nr:hypothetical protein [Pyrinomonadaceae bacterium]